MPRVKTSDRKIPANAKLQRTPAELRQRSKASVKTFNIEKGSGAQVDGSAVDDDIDSSSKSELLDVNDGDRADESEENSEENDYRDGDIESGNESEEEDDDDDYGEVTNPDSEDSDGGDGDDTGVAADGMADMMARILHQKVPTKVPVLAKRKTAMMKEIESDKAEQADQKKTRLDKKKETMKQLVIPSAANNDFERQLRKLATRGVVTLFNAIAKAKRDAAAPSDSGIDNGKASSDTSANNSSKYGEKSLRNQSSPQPADLKATTSTTGPTAGKSWAALNEDYLVQPAGTSLSIKNWDKESDSEDEERAVI